MDISSQLMIFPATASSASTSSAEINAAIIGFVFGSLSRPPESSSNLFSWRNFTELVCMWLQASLYNHISFGNLSIGDVVALWRTLESRYVHREGELRLAQFMQNHDHDILRSGFGSYSDDCYMFLHMEFLVSKGDVMKLVHSDGLRLLAPHMSVVLDGFHATAIGDHAFWRYDHREGELRLDVLKLLEYGIDNGWLVMLLEHPVCEADPLLLLLTFGALRIERCTHGCFEALLISFAMRLIQSDAPCIIEDALTVALLHFFSIRKQFQRHNRLFKNMEIASDQCYLLLVCLCHDKGTSHISAFMRRMENIFQSVAIMDQLVIWWITILPLLKKETSFFCSWLVYNERHISSRCVTSQGEFRSTLRLEAMRFMFLWLSLAYLDEQQMVKQYQIFIESIQSQEGAAICVSKELFSVTSTWSLLEFILTTMIHDSNEEGDFGSDGQYLILVVKSFYKDKEETVSFHITVTSWSITSQSCSHSLIHEDSCGFVGQFMVLICDQALHLIFLHSHSCAFLLSQRWWLTNKKLIVGDCHVLLLQGQSRELYFLGLKIVAHSGGLHTIQCFFFGSLTRPPESQGDFSFMPLKFTWMLLSLEDCRGYEAVKFFKSKMDFHLEGEY